MVCHSSKHSLNLVLTDFGLPSRNESESDLLTKKKRSVIGLKPSTPSYDFRSTKLNLLPINRVPQFICKSLKLYEPFGISLLPLILLTSNYFFCSNFRVAYRAINDWIISRYYKWFKHHLKMYFFERFIKVQVIIVI